VAGVGHVRVDLCYFVSMEEGDGGWEGCLHDREHGMFGGVA
jgi:hypothetical protein